jgi:hypothetical protein
LVSSNCFDIGYSYLKFSFVFRKEMFVAARKIAPQVSGWLEDDENADGVIPRGSLLGMDNVVFSRPYNLDTIAVSKRFDAVFDSDNISLPLVQEILWLDRKFQ